MANVLGILDTKFEDAMEGQSPKERVESSEDEKRKKKNHESPGEKEVDEKQLYSGLLFKSSNDLESGEGGQYDVGFETLNIIEHIEMLNSAAGTLLDKDGRILYFLENGLLYFVISLRLDN